METTVIPPCLPTKTDRRNAATLKLLFIAALVLLLQIPLQFVNALRQERLSNHGITVETTTRRNDVAPAVRPASTAHPLPAGGAAEGYRMVERALKHSVLVIALVFAAFYIFEILAPLRLHAVHYSLVGAALALFYLALLALGEVLEPGPAYIGAAVASSLLVTLYSAAILQSRGRAAVIAGLLASVYGALYVVLRMEDFALLAGTGALFVALAAVMYLTRNIDWSARDAGALPAR